MREPDSLYTIHSDVSPSERRVLVYSFNGFLDAGNACRITVDALTSTLEHRLIATFDTDEILDYRARRPRMTYSNDHFVAVDVPTITLHEVVDEQGTSFLLLAGPEPDFQWGRFIAAVHELVDRFDVDLTVGLSAVPWPIPHTRPSGVTVHGSEPELLVGFTSPLGDIEVPGHVTGMLELHLGEVGHPSLGISVHVPHYLVQFDFPRASVKLINTLNGITGLSLSSAHLEPAALAAEAEVSAQMEGNDEFITVVATLEQQYDAASDVPASPLSTLAPGGEIPTGDEIAASVERFLAEMDKGEDETRG